MIISFFFKSTDFLSASTELWDFKIEILGNKEKPGKELEKEQPGMWEVTQESGVSWESEWESVPRGRECSAVLRCCREVKEEEV